MAYPNVWSSWTSDSTTTSGTNGTWDRWNDSGTNTSTTDTWTSWTTTSAADTSSTIPDYVWTEWNDGNQYRTRIVKPLKKSKQQKLSERRKKKRIAVRAKKQHQRQQRKDKVAEVKAREALMDLLGEDQMKIFEETGRLLIKGEKFDYLLDKNGIISRVEKDKIIDLCVHQKTITEHARSLRFPPSDKLISKILSAKFNEDEFNRIANNTPRSKVMPKKYAVM